MHIYAHNPMSQEEPSIPPIFPDQSGFGIPFTPSSQISEILTPQNASQRRVFPSKPQKQENLTYSNIGSSICRCNCMDRPIHQQALTSDEKENFTKMPQEQFKCAHPHTTSSQISKFSTPQNATPPSIYQAQLQEQQQTLAFYNSGSTTFPDIWMNPSIQQQIQHVVDEIIPSIPSMSQDSLELGISSTGSYKISEISCSQISSTHPVLEGQAEAALKYSQQTQPTFQLTSIQLNSNNQSSNHYVPQHHDYMEQPSTSDINTSKSSRKPGANSVPKGTGKHVCRVNASPALPPTPDLHRALMGLIRRMGPKDVVSFQEPLPRWKAYCIYGSSAIQLKLNADELWSKCHSLNSEMITTNVGRRLFPGLSVSVTGLEPEENYIFFLDFVLTLPYLTKYIDGKWTTNGQAGEYPPRNNTSTLIYVQEDSPKSGREWMVSGVNLIHLKITNNKEFNQNKNMIYLYSMHQYIPRYHVARHRRVEETSRVNAGVQNESYELIGSYIIPGTQFYTATAYQNLEIVKLKTLSNPFAKGFRNKMKDC